MHIGIDARLMYYQMAGIGRYTLQLVRALSRIESDDRYTLLQSRRAREPIIEHPRFAHHKVYTPAHHRLEQLALPFEISHLGLNVLHSPDFIPPFRRKCASVITIHDLNFMLYPHFLTRDAARYYGQIDLAVRRADAIIAVSQATKADIVRLLGVPESKVTVIYEAAGPAFQPLDDPALPDRVHARFGVRGDFVLVCEHHRATQERAHASACLSPTAGRLSSGCASWCWRAKRAGCSTRCSNSSRTWSWKTTCALWGGSAPRSWCGSTTPPGRWSPRRSMRALA